MKKLGSDITYGDVLMFLGVPHGVRELLPYAGCLVDDGILPGGTRIAMCSAGWAMTIVPTSRYEVDAFTQAAMALPPATATALEENR